MGNRIWFWMMLFVVVMSSCRTRTTDPVGYMKYVTNQKNGLLQEKEIDGMNFKVQWMTPEMMALNELKKTEVGKSEWQKIIKEYEGMQYCKLTIEGKNDEHIHAVLASESIDGEEIEAYLNLDAQKSIFLTSGEDTSRCALYSFSKTYGLAKRFEIATGFESNIGKENDDYVFELDASFLERGLVKFRFSKADIRNIPSLNI